MRRFNRQNGYGRIRDRGFNPSIGPERNGETPPKRLYPDLRVTPLRRIYRHRWGAETDPPSFGTEVGVAEGGPAQAGDPIRPKLTQRPARPWSAKALAISLTQSECVEATATHALPATSITAVGAESDAGLRSSTTSRSRYIRIPLFFITQEVVFAFLTEIHRMRRHNPLRIDLHV